MNFSKIELTLPSKKDLESLKQQINSIDADRTDLIKYITNGSNNKYGTSTYEKMNINNFYLNENIDDNLKIRVDYSKKDSKENFKNTICFVENGKFNNCECTSAFMPIRPAIKFKLFYFSKVLKEFKKNNENILEMELGEFPQSKVSAEMQDILNKAFENNKVFFTGKYYNLDSINKYEEYEYNGNKYIKICSMNNNDTEIAWFSVDPVIWHVDLPNRTLISKYILTNEVAYNYSQIDDSLKLKFKSSKIKCFLQDVLFKNLFYQSDISKIDKNSLNQYSINDENLSNFSNNENEISNIFNLEKDEFETSDNNLNSKDKSELIFTGENADTWNLAVFSLLQFNSASLLKQIIKKEKIDCKIKFKDVISDNYDQLLIDMLSTKEKFSLTLSLCDVGLKSVSKIRNFILKLGPEYELFFDLVWSNKNSSKKEQIQEIKIKQL